jgi:Mrp family chromosome partitioning ATPase
MTIEKFLTILVKRWWLVLLCFLTVGAGAYVGSRLMIPLYQSTALIQIAVRSSNNQGDYYSSLLASEQLVQTEATLATSDPVLREVVSHYPEMTVEQLSREVTAAPRLNTQLFEIDVQNPSPTQAAAIANDVATTLIEQQTQVFQQNAVQSAVYLLVVQPAQPNFSPVQPHVLLNSAGGLVTGLLLGMLFAVLLGLLDTHVRTPEALTQLLGWPVLATIWRARSDEEVFNPKRNNANFEAYRTLRTNIGFATIDKPVHTLVVTSATLRDGKSVVAANLAIKMARAGKKTLLIDADLRHPVQGDLFSIPGDSMGLSNAIVALSIPATATSFTNDELRVPPATRRPLDPFIHTVHISNLCVMPSGPLPLHPSELLDSKAMQHLIQALSNSGAEIVIFDTPPILGLSDASIMASKVDGTLVVVDITRARKESLKQVKALLAQAGTRVLGCVINKRRRSRKNTIYSSPYGTDEQKERGDLDVEHAGSLPTLSIGPDDNRVPGTSSQVALREQREEENHSTSNVNFPVAPANAFNASDQTIKLPQVNRRKDEQCEDR